MIFPDRLHAALRHEGGLSRRLFLAYGASLSSLPLLGRAQAGQPAKGRPSFDSDPFSLGVASGDPGPDSVVLWTRLAPSPLEPGSGLPPEPLAVRWELAEDEAFRKLVASGRTMATPQLGHSVHVIPRGLEPDRWYWYRFRCGDATSPVGRTRTLPRAGAMPERMRFAFASCQHYETGLYTAYEHLAGQDFDLVFHLGDYIYEKGGIEGRLRQHHGAEIESLDDYRARYAQYKSDPLLQMAHAHCPWMVTWDDHEVDNNYADHISEEAGVDPAAFLLRRANAYQAYYENMPLRPRSFPKGPDLRLYRKASFGRLAEFCVLDTRQYRSDQPNGDKPSPLNAEATDPANSLLGSDQRHWLQSSLLRSRGTWNVLAQQVMMGLVDRAGAESEEERRFSMDQWPAAAAERAGLMEFLAERRVPNPVVLTGDIHSNWVNELRVDDRRPEGKPIAAEFVGTSISSSGDGVDVPGDHDAIRSANPFLKFYNRQRGYVGCTLTPETWTSDYYVTDKVSEPGGKTSKRASFVLEKGSSEVQEG